MSERHDRTPAALYARVSSDRQDVDLSVSAQLRALRDYADKNDYEVVREYVDEAESGRVLNRPGVPEDAGRGQEDRGALRGDIGLEVLPLHPQARARRHSEVHAQAQGPPRRLHNRAGRGQPHRQAPRRHHRDRGRVLQREFGDGSPAGYEGGRIQGLLGRSHGPLRLQEGQGAGRPQGEARPGTGPRNERRRQAHLRPGRDSQGDDEDRPHPQRRGHRQPQG